MIRYDQLRRKDMKYTVTILDKFDNRSFTGHFEANSIKEAKAKAKAIDIYTYELDTDEDGIVVTEIK